MGVSVVMAGANCFASTRRPGLARKAYLRAVELRRQLEARPARSRKAADYKRVIREFRNVYIYDFAYTKAPVAAEAMGDLYAEMGRAFSSPDDFHAAIKAYQYVISQYPVSSMARDSALSVGKVYLDGLNDPAQAADAFRAFLEKHPSSPQSAVARKSLKEIADKLAARKKTVDRLAAQRRSALRGNEGSPDKRTSNGLVEVTEIHDWAGPNYTRVVIGAQGPFQYNTLRLSNPDRIVFDLPNTRLSHSLLKKRVRINGDFLHDIRAGQFKPNVTRIVLDVKNIQDYSAFPLPNPFRLIIDVHGSSPQMAKHSPKRATPASHLPAEPGRTVQASVAEKTPIVKVASPLRTKPEVEAARRIQTAAKRKAKATSVAHIRKTANRKTDIASTEPAHEAIPVSTKPASPTGNGSQTLTRALGLKVARIVIDPGHGGFDTGTIGPTGLEEKDVVLDIALRLRKLIETQTDSQVVMTRSTDKFIPLEERTAIANEKDADLFISIHANASHDHHVRGIETYFLNFTTDPEALELAARENATSQESVHQLQNLIKKIALSDKVDESRELAHDVQTVLYKDMSRASHGIHNRGVRKAPFVVLIGANMPSILAEISFLSNPHSEHLLREPSYREKIAKALFQGIEDYVNNLGSVRVAQRTR